MPSGSASTPPVYRSMPSTRDEAKAEEKQVAAPAELSKQADAAMRSGNRVREAELLRQALAAGATGKERLGLLNRLCDAEFAIGRRQAAMEACSLVLEEDPRSSAAQARARSHTMPCSPITCCDDSSPGRLAESLLSSRKRQTSW